MALEDKFLIAPSILSADFSCLGEEVKKVVDAGADWIHVDVMDGHFVPNITIGPDVVKGLRRATTKPLDVHLMIENPEKYVPSFASAGADFITIHVEATKDPEKLLKTIRALNCKAGITLRPGTPLKEILPYIKFVDLVLIMTVEPGFGGQKFLKDQVKKIKELRDHIEPLKNPPLIEVDGGVNEETVRHCEDADVIVSGSYIFRHKNYFEAISCLKNVRKT